MPGITELLASLSDGFGVIKDGLDELKVTRTRGATTAWHDVVMEGVEFTPGDYRPDKPTWSYKNELDVPISLRRIEVLFDDEPDDAYKPVVEIDANLARFFRSSGNAFQSQDIAVDLYGGKDIAVGFSVDVYIWAAAAATKKAATISAQFGEV